MGSASGAVGLIYTIITICIIIMVILIGVVLFIWWKSKNAKTDEDSSGSSDGKSSVGKGSEIRMQGIESMSKFLAFDQVVDNMIVRKKGEQYVMVIQCKGVNFDLLGEEEKIAVENGFVQFLNIIRFPIQLYVQTRRLNLTANIDKYTQKMNEINQEIMTLDAQIKKETANGRMEIVKKLQFDKRRKENILDYGLDVTNYVARLSQNKEVLQQNTYVVLSYFKSEIGGEVQNYSKEEIDSIAFSELYTRAQTLIRGLSSCGVNGRVLNSEELAELLYVAYNRDDSEIINIRKSVNAEFDSLYNIAKDVMDKQKELIEKNIDEEAVNLTANSIRKADRIRKLRKEHEKDIKKKALDYVEAYKYDMTDELYDETKRQIENADLAGEEGSTAEKPAKKEASSAKAKTMTDEERKRRILAKRKAAKIKAMKEKAAREKAASASAE